MRVSDPTFVKTWLAASGIADMMKATGLSYTAVRSRATALRKRGVKLPHLQRGRRAHTPEATAHLNTIIDLTLRDEAGSATPLPPGAGIFYPPPPAPVPVVPARSPFLAAVLAWWIPARTGIELDATELIGELGAMDKPPPRECIAPQEIGRSLEGVLPDLAAAGILVTSRIVAGKTLWKFGDARGLVGRGPEVR